MARTPSDIRLTVARAASESVARGHPWVYREALARADLRAVAATPAGTEVQLLSVDGKPLARGLLDPDSPIAVRAWSWVDERIDRALLDRRARAAFATRAALVARDGVTDAYRLLHGEGDRTPGFVIDRYREVAILKTDGAAARARRDEFALWLRPALESAGVRTLVLREGGRGEPVRSTVAYGPLPPEVIEVREHGIPFLVDLARGQKTGAFLDQRDNRRRAGELARGRSVLNLFSYAGGFSLFAARGGATRVTSVDVAAAAHVTAQESFRAAAIDPRAHEFVSADAFAFLTSAKQRGRTWDLVISDPPSFAPSAKTLPRAVAAYRALHRACAEVLAPGGLFCAASCSSHVDAATFAGTLDDAALGRSDLRILEMHGAPLDHPTLAAMPEGRYLKFFVLG